MCDQHIASLPQIDWADLINELILTASAYLSRDAYAPAPSHHRDSNRGPLGTKIGILSHGGGGWLVKACTQGYIHPTQDPMQAQAQTRVHPIGSLLCMQNGSLLPYLYVCLSHLPYFYDLTSHKPTEPGSNPTRGEI